MFRKSGPVLINARQAEVVKMLRAQETQWTAHRLTLLIQSGGLPEEYIEGAAEYIKDKPHLWFVSAEEFEGAVAQINPECARLFATPQGRAFQARL